MPTSTQAEIILFRIFEDAGRQLKYVFFVHSADLLIVCHLPINGVMIFMAFYFTVSIQHIES